MNVSAVRAYFVDLQQRIVSSLEAIDGRPFRRDEWTRPEGGGGIACLIEEGNVLERGGVNFSHVRGDRLPPAASAGRGEIAGRAWEALGVSLVLHPRNPYAPTVHLNGRMFAAYRPESAPSGEDVSGEGPSRAAELRRLATGGSDHKAEGRRTAEGWSREAGCGSAAQGIGVSVGAHDIW